MLLESLTFKLSTLIYTLQLIPYFGLVIFGFCLFFAYQKLSLSFYLLAIALYLSSIEAGRFSWIFFAIFTLLFLVPSIRRLLITKPIITLIKKLGLLPKISETEKIALTSGNVWIDGELFSGKPNFKEIFSQNYPTLTSEEQSFLDNEVEAICQMCSDYETQVNRDLPERVWKFLREKKFFGMVIPKEFGGLGFSAYAHSCVIEKLSSRSVALAITAMVPNSLGPAELLLHYGTEEQRNYYLPRLADGQELPCFALTEDGAGSDATSIIANGTLFKDHDGKIKIRLNWKKRYITLGAYATLIGVAFQLRDPENLMFTQTEIGITCALIPHTTPGVRQGRRHDPLGVPFINSPLNGENVIIGLDGVIGGANGLGKGWKMLMECLAAGRGISLPSTSSGGSKFVARVISAYTAIRQQFGLSISKFEGVEEVLARVAARTYAVDALRAFTAGAIDSGNKPAVITAIAKYHATEMFRQNINDGMDIMGGRGIIRGPRNLLANAYASTPISITVEGANILTRSLIQFGQGAMMCHPYVYKEIEALQNNDLKAFDQSFFGHINHLISNLVRSILLSITRGHIHKPFMQDIITRYERKIMWCSATFAFLADIAIARFGGDLKRKEKINGRFGDVLSAMYISTCVLRKFKENKYREEEKSLVAYAIREQLNKAQTAIEGLYQNLFGLNEKLLLLPFCMWSRFNNFICPPNDKLGHEVVKNFVKKGQLREGLTKGVFVSKDRDDNLGRLEYAMCAQIRVQPIVAKIKSAIAEGSLPKKRVEDLVQIAHEKSILNLEETHQMQDAIRAIADACQVDEYTLDELKNL